MNERKYPNGPRVVAMSPEGAKAFFGLDDDPIDCGPPFDTAKYKPGARVYVFPRKNVVWDKESAGRGTKKKAKP